MAGNVDEKDHWSSDAYQKAAGFVPKLATKVVDWLDVQPGDVMLDIGCGDAILTLDLARRVGPTGLVHGLDSSSSMITSANNLLQEHPLENCEFILADASSPTWAFHKCQQRPFYDKVFSNAAMHWILRPPSAQDTFFPQVHSVLIPGGVFVFEMGGFGNVAEMRAALLSVVSRRLGIQRAREADPWFFPDENWARTKFEAAGFVVEKSEMEYRPTKCVQGEGGGVEGWVLLMGKQFFDAVGAEKGNEERESCVKEVVEVLRTVCERPDGESWIGYVRLRVRARKVA